MSEQQTNVDTVDAREASKSRVVTFESLLDKPDEPPASEAVPEKEDTPEKTEEKPKGKRSPQERIQQLANARREAELKASNIESENARLRDEIKALKTALPALQVEVKPQRQHYVNESDYVEAYADWKATKVLADREAQQEQARLEAASDQVRKSFEATKEAARVKYEDFDTVVANSRIAIPEVLAMAIMESPVGGDMTYYLASHPDELRKIVDIAMLDKRPVKALKQLDKLEEALMAEDDELDEPEEVIKPKAKRAPEPIRPVSGTSAIPTTSAKGYAEYRARRMAESKR